MKRIDFIWTTFKDFACVKPIYDYFLTLGWECDLVKIHKHKFRNLKKIKNLAPFVVAAYDIPIRRLEKLNWSGKIIYVDHGVGPIKYYAYRYKYFHDCALLFYQGEVFKRKMEAVNPGFKNGLLGGFVKMDELINLKVDRLTFCQKYDLNPVKPIILFAPTWGGKDSKHWGIRNAKYMKGVQNLIIAPHSSDYKYAKKFNAIVPEIKSNINEIIKVSDLIVSDVSSIIGEAAAINKPVVQLVLSSYPGCFPNYDKRKEGSWVHSDIIDYEEKNTDRSTRPFKIAYLDDDWVVGHTTKPENLLTTISDAIQHPDKYKKERKYWGEQCCWKADGKTIPRIAEMIKIFIDTGKRVQI